MPASEFSSHTLSLRARSRVVGRVKANPPRTRDRAPLTGFFWGILLCEGWLLLDHAFYISYVE